MSERFNEIEADPKNACEELDVKTGISNSRDDIGSIVEDSHGFFTLDGERCGTVKVWSAYLGIPEYRITKRIKEEKIKPTVRFRQRLNKGPVEKYYPEHIFKDFLLEKIVKENSIPIANEQGYFIRDGKMAGTLDFWVKHFNLDKTTFRNQMEKDKIPGMEGKTHDKKEETFYWERHIQVIISRWCDSQKQLLEELYSGHKLPRMRIKKNSRLHAALKGDVILAIPKEYTGIYQLLQNEFNLKPPKSKEVYVLFDKRGGVSVVLKSELEEIR